MLDILIEGYLNRNDFANIVNSKLAGLNFKWQTYWLCMKQKLYSHAIMWCLCPVLTKLLCTLMIILRKEKTWTDISNPLPPPHGEGAFLLAMYPITDLQQCKVDHTIQPKSIFQPLEQIQSFQMVADGNNCNSIALI